MILQWEYIKYVVCNYIFSIIRAVTSRFFFYLRIPSKWENLAHNGLICFFQHNYIPTFEQWLWDRVCVLSTWFGDICGSRRDFCMFYKRSGPLISNSIRCGCLRTDQCVPVPAKLHTEMHWQYWPSPLCEAASNCSFWSTPCESGCRRY